MIPQGFAGSLGTKGTPVIETFTYKFAFVTIGEQVDCIYIKSHLLEIAFEPCLSADCSWLNLYTVCDFGNSCSADSKQIQDRTS